MYEVFINYRRDDTGGFLLTLRDRLPLALAGHRVFIDEESIDLGEDLDQKIESSLRQAKILIPVIGPVWTAPQEKTGKSRLWDENDYVRREIEIAIKGGLEIIPVLVGTAKMPSQELVPESIRPLLVKKALVLHGAPAEVELQWKALVERIKSLLDVEGPRPDPPELLPTLCDRDVQWKQVDTCLSKQLDTGDRRAAMFVLPGRVDEAHAAFMQRIRDESLPEWVTKLTGGGKVVCFEKRESFDVTSPEEIKAEFRRFLAREMANRPAECTNRELVAALETARARLTIVVLHIHKGEMANAPVIVEAIGNFWKEFPVLPRDQLLLMFVCVRVGTSSGSSWWKSLMASERTANVLLGKLKDFGNEKSSQFCPGLCLLPQLESPEFEHLERWKDHPKVQRYIGGRHIPAEDLDAVLDHKERRPMDKVIPGLEDLLRKYRKP